MKKILVIILMLLVTLTLVNAIQPTQQFNKIFLNPIYRNLGVSGVWYDYNVTISAPDGISAIKNAMVTFDLWMTPTVNFNLLVNGQTCNNPTYQIHTTYAGSGSATIFFDCTNIIKYAGDYNIQLKSDKNTGAVTAWVDLTYMTNPIGALNVHGTEYFAGTNAKLWLQLLNSSGSEVNQGICYTNIYTPDGVSYITEAQMTNMLYDGIYYYDLQAPDIEGVYPIIAKCYYTATTTKFYPYAYVGTILKQVSFDSTIYLDTQLIDGEKDKFKELKSPIDARLDFYLNWSPSELTSCANINPSLLTSILVSLYGRFDSVINDDITIYIYNWTNASWRQLPNKLLENNIWKYASNTISVNNITASGLYSNTYGIRIRFTDTELTDGGEDELEIEQLYVGCNQLSNPLYQEVKGSSEMHVSPSLYQVGGYTYPFFIYTRCGNEDIQSGSSSCGLLQDSYVTLANESFTEPQGVINGLITFVNYQQANIDSFFRYETPVSIDCTAILDIYENRSGVVTDIYDTVTFQEGSQPDNCKIIIPVVFNASENDFQVSIISDNYIRWEVQRDNRLIAFYRQTIEDYCYQLANISLINMTVPIITNLSEHEENTPLLGCWQSIDDLYWFDDYFDILESSEIVSDDISALIGARFYYPEILNSFNIVQGLKINTIKLFDVITDCEKSDNINIIGNDDFSCQIMVPPDDYFSSQEGWMLANLTFVNTYHTTIDTSFDFPSAIDTDCTSVLDIIRIDEYGNEVDIYNESKLRGGDFKNCKLVLPIHFNANETYFNILIKQENYVNWNMMQMRDKVNAIRDNTGNFCENLLAEDGIDYYLPINSSIDYVNDSLDRFCWRALDDLYWFDFFDAAYQEIELPVRLFEMMPVYDEFNYFYPYIMANELAIKVIEDFQVSNDLANSIGIKIWNYTNRTLTEHPNYTSEFEGINNKINNISIQLTDINISLATNILSVPYNVWTYLTRNLTYYEDVTDYTQGALYVWNSTNRNLTYFPTQIDLTNYTKLVDDTWNYVARYTHGVILS